MLWRKFVSGHISVKTICQCLCFSEDNCPVLWRQLGSAQFRGDNCPRIWRQFGSALFSVKTIFQCSIFHHFSPFLVKTIVLLLLILWRQLYYWYLFCEDNCTSAHEDNFTSEDNCTISHIKSIQDLNLRLQLWLQNKDEPLNCLFEYQNCTGNSGPVM